MKTGTIAAVAVTICALPAGYALFHRNRCAPLNDAVKAKLLSYVQKKYKVATSAGLQLTENSPVGSSCYRKLEFKSQNSPRPIRISLFATPDLKYLSRELLDADADPVLEVTGKQRELPSVAAGALPSLGPTDAPVTVAVFSDFECPYCARFAAMMSKEVLPAEGKHVRFVFRQFPLPMHPWARAAAEASACAYKQKNDYFWSLHDFFFDHQGELTAGNIQEKVLAYVGSVAGLDRAQFAACLSKGETRTAVESEVAFGNDNGIHATPTVFINGKQAQAGDAAQMLELVRQLAQDPNGPVPPPAQAATPKQHPQPRVIADVASADSPTLGPPKAAVTLTVFSDFQCPYCAKFADMMRKEVLPVAGGNVRLVFRYLPLSMHPWAKASAGAAACAYQQKHEYFWNFHDFFFERQRELTPANLRQEVMEHARGVPGLDPSKFEKCLAQDGGKALVERDANFAAANGLEATPTVFLNGKETEIVAAEQLLTLIRELSPRTTSSGTRSAAPLVR